MANQIGRFFGPQRGDPAISIADHLRKFWDPHMRATIVDHVKHGGAGLDPIAAGDFDILIRDLQRSLNLTVVMVTHDLDTLAAITDRIAVLLDRRIMVGTMSELMALPHPWIRKYFHGPRGRAARHEP